MIVMDDYLWIAIAGFIVSFVLAFGIGANDVANSMGTSVGSKVLTLKSACLLATIFEISGSVLLGYKVSDTIRKGIIDVDEYKAEPQEYMLGNLSALGGSAIWLIIATFLKMPISGTHSIVGAVLGFSIVSKGFSGINWWTLAKIVGSWFVSPVLSGMVSGSLFFLIRKFILSKNDPIEPGLASLPMFYGVTILINILSIVLDGPDMLKMEVSGWPKWTEPVLGVAIATLIAILVATVVYLVMVPRLRRQIGQEVTSAVKDPPVVFVIGNGVADSVKDKEFYKDKLEVIPMDGLSPNSSAVPLIKQPDVEGQLDVIVDPASDTGDQPGVGKLFSFLQILTAAFGSFAHGGNDVSNAIGPLIALWLVYKEGSIEQKTQTPIWLLVYGGVGISLGLWIWGRRVIKTMGEDLTKITPSSGFTIEIGAAMTVLVASKIGLPISTTHCKVGSVVSVGWLRTKGGVDWKLFRNIIFAWLVTVPVSGGLSALLMFILKSTAM